MTAVIKFLKHRDVEHILLHLTYRDCVIAPLVGVYHGTMSGRIFTEGLSMFLKRRGSAFLRLDTLVQIRKCESVGARSKIQGSPAPFQEATNCHLRGLVLPDYAMLLGPLSSARDQE